MILVKRKILMQYKNDIGKKSIIIIIGTHMSYKHRNICISHFFKLFNYIKYIL